MPDCFLVLVKQYGNLSSNNLAARVVDDIYNSLFVTLNETQRKAMFRALPKYLQPSRQYFFARVTHWNKDYRHMVLLERLQTKQNLTDISEVENRLQAFFIALQITQGKVKYREIRSALPLELRTLA